MQGENITITLTKYPTTNKGVFKDLVKRYYNKYRTRYLKTIKGEPETSKLLKPLIYHLFSNYDAAIICLTQSEKFSQRLFSVNDNDAYLNTDYQIQTGSIIDVPDIKNEDEKFNLRDYLVKITKPNEEDELLEGRFRFAIISNFCVNKGLKLGLGLKLFNKIYIKIDEIVLKHNCEFLLTQSNSWFDISLTLFSDNHSNLYDVILELRKLRLKDVWADKDYDFNENCCLYSVFYNSNKNKIHNAHVFVESSSFFGVEYNYMERNQDDDNYMMDTLLEWKVKSGHEVELCRELANLGLSNGEIKYLNGKMDLVIQQPDKSLRHNLDTFKLLRTPDSKLLSITKQIRTNVMYDLTQQIGADSNSNEEVEIDEVLDFTSKLKKLIFSAENINDIDKTLKALKVSRHIREKVKKCFSIVNYGLTDSILFEFYTEMIPWMKRLYWCIMDDLKHIKKIQDMETILLRYIEVYDSAYRDRTFTTYLFEDIHDLSVQYNASVIQLISMYNTCLHIITKDYYTNHLINNTTRSPRFLVSVNLNNTMSNDNSVNFHIHDITTPELLLVSIHKELFNYYINSTGYQGYATGVLRSKTLDIIQNEIFNGLHFKLLENTNLTQFDHYNILNDLVRLLVVYNWDFELYAYWLWSFNIQNTQLYNKNGFLNEQIFIHEMIRFLSVKRIVGYEADFECPVPELYVYWNRYIVGLNKEISKSITQDRIENVIKEVFYNAGFLNKNLKCPDSGRLGRNRNNDKSLNIGYDAEHRVNVFRDLEHQFRYHFDSDFQQMYKFLRSKKEQFNLRHTLEFFIYIYLKTLKDAQKNKLGILRRNLDTGEPMKSFIDHGSNTDVFYLLDPQGGNFLWDQSKLATYNRLRSNITQIIWDITLRWKLQYLNERTKSDKKV